MRDDVARSIHPISAANLSGANLSHVDLYYANLSPVNINNCAGVSTRMRGGSDQLLSPPFWYNYLNEVVLKYMNETDITCAIPSQVFTRIFRKIILSPVISLM